MNTHGVKELSDVAVLVVTVIEGFKKANADGKFTTREKIGLVFTTLDEAIAAADGFGEVLAELKDLQPEELDQIYSIVVQAVPANTVTWTRFNSVMSLIYQAVATYRVFDNTDETPPKAEVVQEIDGVDPP